jgi:ABC-2 type transport system permease protein
MEAEAKNIFRNILDPYLILGPLFDKELRVSSRRKRNYFLRFAYIILLMIFVVGTWFADVQMHGSVVYQKSRLAEVGKNIIMTIVLFQFFSAQVIAIILLSNSISDEIYHRTLGVLMTTPINSLQIVTGKLFSKLLQIIILLAISLPILAIVRVFGGVSWSYIFSSLCITLAAAIFAGSVSLAFSIKNTHTYVVIIKSFFILGVLYVFIPLLMAAIFGKQWLYVLVYGNPISDYPLLIAVLHFNPLGMISLNTAMMTSPFVVGFLPFHSWFVHCIIMLILSVIILAFAVKVVRKVALRQILGQLDLFSRMRLSFSKKKSSLLKEYEGSIREVTGQPVLWKEVRKPIIQGIDNTNNKIGLALTIAALLLTYFVCYLNGCLDADITHESYAIIFVIIGMIFNIVLAVSCITYEKESSAWPILLTTSLNDTQIIQGKAMGVFYRCLPVWLLLAGHILIFVLVGYIHPIAIVQLPVILFGLIVFLTGFGLYLSSCFRRTTWAIITLFGFAFTVWMFIPIILRIAAELSGNRELFGLYYSANPVIQVSVIMDGISGKYNSNTSLDKISYNWPFIKNYNDVFSTTKLLLYIMSIYILLGISFGWLAMRRIRRNSI